MFSLWVEKTRRSRIIRSKNKNIQKVENVKNPVSQEKEEKAAQYRLKCKKRYNEDKRKYRETFMNKISEYESLQPYALAGVRVSRIFSHGVPLKYSVLKDPLTESERRRVEFLLADKPFIPEWH